MIWHDRTKSREAQEAISEERRALEILNRAGSALAAKTDLQELVQIVTDAGVELTGAEFGAFFYNVENEAGESYMLYTLSGAPAEAFSKFPMPRNTAVRSEEHTSELQSLMRISYAVFCMKKKKTNNSIQITSNHT